MTKRTTRPAGKLKEEGARYIPKGIDPPGKPMQTAKLFKNGRSQAVRLPKEFRFEGDEVYVRREGRSIVLSPKAADRAAEWRDFFDALDSFDPRFPLELHRPTEHQVRKSVGMVQPPRRKRSRSK
jgi:antitoxin VapB